MLTLRQRVFIVIGIIAGLIIAGTLFLLSRYYWIGDEGVESTGDTEMSRESIEERPSGSEVTTHPREFIPHSDEVYVKQLASIFVERFASFSNQNNDQHIADIEDMVTPKMLGWIKSQADDLDAGYEGTTTVVLSTETAEYSSTKAVITVGTQQTIFTENIEGDIEQEMLQRYADVNLIKTGDTWKVDGLWWRE